jgi:hypothetical protein
MDNPATPATPAHPLSDLLPPLQDWEFESLKESIEKTGLDEPILLFEEQILDGRNRERICLELGVKPKYKRFTGDYAAAIRRVCARIYTRSLSKSQRAMIAVKATIFAKPGRPKELNSRRQRRNATSGATFLQPAENAEDSAPGDPQTPPDAADGDNAPATKSVTAEALGVSASLVEKAAAVHRSSTPLADAVSKGLISLRTALMLKDLTPEEQILNLKRVRQGLPKESVTAAELAKVDAAEAAANVPGTDEERYAARQKQFDDKKYAKLLGGLVRANEARAVVYGKNSIYKEMKAAIEKVLSVWTRLQTAKN